jgi:hypothetical protein
MWNKKQKKMYNEYIKWEDEELLTVYKSLISDLEYNYSTSLSKELDVVEKIILNRMEG